MKVSVIMVCYNAGKELDRTLSSILMQNVEKEEMELLIIDGASTDNTGEIVARYLTFAQKSGYIIRFYSEPDNGIYDAMNKGAKLAKGEWCIYMNAGDRFFDKNSLHHLLNETDKNYGFIYGDTILKQPIKSAAKYILSYAPNESECNFLNSMPFCHQSSLIQAQLLKDNPFRTKYKIVGDYDFFARIFQKVSYHHVNFFISVFSCDGISTNNPDMRWKENVYVALDNGLISREEYDKRVLLFKEKKAIKKFIPKFVFKIRSHILHLNKPRYTWQEIREKYR